MATVRNLGIALAVACAACQPGSSQPARGPVGGTMEAFSGAVELDAFARKLARAEQDRVQHLNLPYANVEMEAPADAAAAAPALTKDIAEGSAAGQITNVQEQGVDEGGIVKVAGEYLIVLRRGRLFTVRHGNGALEPVDRIDAFPPGKADAAETWYDEMLVKDDQVIVIGYSYGSNGTEVNRFRLAPDGRLTYRDTHYLSSGDYYSSSNYASRLIGDTLVFYSPVVADWANWRDAIPALRKRQRDGRIDTPQRLVDPGRLYVAQPYRDARHPLEVLHTVTRCDLSAAELDCKASAVAGAWSREFYVARDAVYVWTSGVGRFDKPDDVPVSGQLYRLPLDGGAPSAIGVKGGPIDQFSFREDKADGLLRVVLRAEAYGGAMWSSEVSEGDVALLSLPLKAFGNGSGQAAAISYRKLPKVDGWRFQNRFVGNYLLYAAADYDEENKQPFVNAVPLRGDETLRIVLPHGVTRLDMLGNDAVAVGPGRGGALGFSAISLGREAKLEDSYLLPSASEGEVRSQAFYYRPDPDSADRTSGTLGLPVARRLERGGAEFLGSGSAVFFLRRNARKFSPAGDLVADSAHAANDNCVASCVDWYGNARPIFLGNRIFALMGYELVEDKLRDGRIGEIRRLDFAPAGKKGR